MNLFGKANPETPMEVDSDVNEDPGRERQLDASFEDWSQSAEFGVGASGNARKTENGSSKSAAGSAMHTEKRSNEQ
ncbi:hypothetical protein ACFQI7_06780 [Paenibacillus allorhizosphaerae]|uniref:DUF4025 domain-containing protein n=1 Tax=Paenibacillus allorhizosphaerae TaxID=2849866 RepID=A0ABM8VFQ1_9BACL|nr:hypothetical protein [Paenibacillus allorhizosphaerae]CAG7635742.1 hypothetical protein PAECIP111802_02174 [Paenibacillus allorhizosphaerae]